MQRFACRHCGKGFLAKPWSSNGTTATCKRAKCEKQSNIYQKPMTASEMAQKANANMTPEQKQARAKKGARAHKKKYGPDAMKRVRAGKKLKPV